MKILFAFLFLYFLPAVLLAQPIPVRTGEHADFTRIVVRLPPGTDWRFGRGADGYVLRLPASDGYDLQRFFDLIPRTRITGVSQDQVSGLLRMSIGCDCRAEVFVTEQNYLVIDISDGEPNPASPFEQPLDTIWAQAERQPAQLRLPLVLPRPRLLQLPLPFATEGSPFQSQTVSVPDADILDALARRVGEGLGWGLSDGLLSPDLDPLPMPSSVSSPITRVPGVLVRDYRDRPDTHNVSPPDPDSADCIPDSFVDLKSWADDRPFHVQTAEMRSRLVQDIDHFKPELIAEFARLHLYFGFGFEAKQILQLDRLNSQERQYYLAIAAIMDDEPIAFPAAQRQANCPSVVALWAFLAPPLDAVPAVYDRTAIIRSFKDLPAFMQLHLGPRLAERFAGNNDHDAAQQALAAARLMAPRAVATRLADATLAAFEGNDQIPIRTLTDLTQDSPRITAEVMNRYLTEANRLGHDISADDMVLADALRFEAALLPTAGDLAATQIQAYLAANSFEDALRLMVEEKAALGPSRYSQLMVDFGLAASASMSNADFVNYAYGNNVPENAPVLQDQMAARLIDLGFYDRAMQVLSPRGAVSTDEGRRYLQALALLQLREPEAVLLYLGADTSERAQQLKLAARAMRAGNLTAISGLASPDNFLTMWRNGDWAGLTRSDDPLMKDAAIAILNTNEFVFDETQPITSGRMLMNQTAQSRDMVDQLFRKFLQPTEF